MDKIAILGMGGTIASILTSKGYSPAASSKELIEFIPEVLQKYQIITKEIMQIDSSNLQPHHWNTIADEIYSFVVDPTVKGVVVVHGTDQLVYSSSAVSFMIQTNKPIVFTGAQIPLSVIGSDGRKNLIDSIRVAAESEITECIIVFNSKIMRAVRTVKLREYDLDAFECVDPTIIGDIAHDIHLYDTTTRKNIRITPSIKPLDLSIKIGLVTVFPGMSSDIIRHMVSIGYKGIILQGFGAGNIPIEENSLVPIINELTEQGVVIVVTSQCIFGTTELLYVTGNLAKDAGAIPGYDLTLEAAITKLHYVLSYYNHSVEDIQRLMHINLVGELNPIINKNQSF